MKLRLMMLLRVHVAAVAYVLRFALLTAKWHPLSLDRVSVLTSDDCLRMFDVCEFQSFFFLLVRSPSLLFIHTHEISNFYNI